MRCAARAILAGMFAASLAVADPAATPAPAVPPTRIIANAPSNAEIVCALGACEYLVGVSTFVTYPRELRALPRVGGLDDPDLEAIIALRPDLILQRGRNQHVANLCAEHGIRMYVDRTDSLPTLYTAITDIGELLARRQQADELVASIQKRLADIAQRAPARRPRVLLALRSPDRIAPLTTVGKPSYLHEIITLAGGDNVFADSDLPYPTIGLEEIVARRPDIILDAMPGEDLSGERGKTLLEQWAVLGSVPAVAHGDIHLLTEDYALTPSPRVLLLAEKLHGIFADFAAETEPK